MTTTNFIASYLTSQNRTWEHDRSATIGASEIGQCARRIWFMKTGAVRDLDHVESRGAAARGDLIERHVWLPALLAWAKSIGASVHFAGDEQATLTDGYLSATPDAIVVMPDGEHVLRECKSIDPRVDLSEAKAVHRDQVQVQLGIVINSDRFKPTRAIIDYIDASFLDRLTQFEVTPAPEAYPAAKARALHIMDATHALHLRPEGKMAGGKECANCPYASHCAHEQAAGIPAKADVPLGDNAISALADAVDRADRAADAEKFAKATRAEAQEEIKEILRAHGARRVETDQMSVSWSSVKGRETVDTKAAIAAGLDLSPFTKCGDPSERLTLKNKVKEKEAA